MSDIDGEKGRGDPEPLSDDPRDAIDDYLSGRLDEERTRGLEDRLRADPDLRRHFARYARLETDLQLEMRARHAGEQALGHLVEMGPAETTADRSGRRRSTGDPGRSSRLALVAALALVGLVGAGALLWKMSRPGPAVAWLVNAQNCQWSGGVEPMGDMLAGMALRLESGLAEIRFACGAKVILEGPAALRLLSGSSARLEAGRLTARVLASVAGFEVLSPQGKVVDLGTEFGVSVAADGATHVYVFEGRVEAHASEAGEARSPVRLTTHQAARISSGRVTVGESEASPAAGRYVRAIVPPPVIAPRTLGLAFDGPIARGFPDRDGHATGFTHRLPGTGGAIASRDPNLRVDAARGQLELTTTRSDINHQQRLHRGEYLGVRLSDLGFTGEEDFLVTATIPDSPELVGYGQFGLYAGTRSDRNIRGGVIKWGDRNPGHNTQFLVNNDGGRDTDVDKVGLLSPGTDLRLTLRRSGGRYSLAVENLTRGSTSTLQIRHPDFLDGEPDLYVGLFGANPYTDERRTVIIKEFSVTVWTVTPLEEVPEDE